MRTALGFILAPLAPALLVLGARPIVGPLLEPGSTAAFLSVLTLFSPFFAVPATAVFAIPLYVWFRQRRWLTLHHTLLGGVFVGMAVTVVFAVYGFFTSPNPYHLSDGRIFVNWNAVKELLAYAALFVPYGLVMAFVFWLVAYWKRKPNNTVERDGPQAARPSL